MNSAQFLFSDSAEQMDFMGHSCCQTKLNKIWNGKMALYTPTWKILASMFMPFFLFSVKFHDEPVGRSDDEVNTSTFYYCNGHLNEKCFFNAYNLVNKLEPSYWE